MPASPNTPVGTIGVRVADLRARRGYTATELGEKLEAVGVPWNRFTVKALESGKRQNVTVTELLALARVLNVAPVHLVVPPDAENDTLYQVTPSETVPAKTARAWIRGMFPILGGKAGEFHAEVPDDEYGWVTSTDDSAAVLRTIVDMRERLDDLQRQIKERGVDDEQKHQEAPER